MSVAQRAPAAIDAAGNGESVFDLFIDDAVPAGNHGTGLVHRVLSAAEDLGEHLDRRPASGKADNVERRERLPSHRVHIGERVRGGDASKRVRVVDDRRKEIDGLNEGEIIGQDENARIVEGLTPNEQAGVVARREWGYGAREVTRTHLGGSTGAAGERGETEELVAGV